jgi:hypothetical protein
MHLATANPISSRVVTRSKSKAEGAAEGRREALGAADAAHQHNAPGLAGFTDLHALKPAALSTQQVPGHHAALLPSSAAKRAATASVVAPAAPAGRLHATLSDDLQHLLDKSGHQQLIAAATAAASRLTHPSLLRHTGISAASKHSAAEAAAATGTTALPPLRKQAAASPASHSRGEHSASISSEGSSRHTAHTGRGGAAAAGHATATSTRTSSVGGGRRVSFAPGPLHSSPAVRSPVTDDGHPATEGALAMPVRRVPSSYALDLTRGNVLMLEQLLGPESAMSVSRLKRRVGLLPPIRPPRPHACSRPAGSDWVEADEDNEEEAAVSMAAATAAAVAAATAAQAGLKLPGRARGVMVGGSRTAGASHTQ